MTRGGPLEQIAEVLARARANAGLREVAPPAAGDARPPAAAPDPEQLGTGALAARCRSCGALIYWATSTNGKSMPVDVEPSPRGNVRLFRRPDGTIRADVLGKEAPRPPGQPLRLCHFVTCAKAHLHRKGTR